MAVGWSIGINQVFRTVARILGDVIAGVAGVAARIHPVCIICGVASVDAIGRILVVAGTNQYEDTGGDAQCLQALLNVFHVIEFKSE